ncbi:hypothetical protein VTL71DRAFT_1311 [Oculimacula yallundae]|uniref:Altered inheritance of mitochondria protein 6 n=1 Tax=Oculimacula yallundae TaxID=86028 RepID=A0ABR4CBI1_9HELO
MKPIGLKSFPLNSEKSRDQSETGYYGYRHDDDSESSSCTSAKPKVHPRDWSMRRKVICIIVCFQIAAIAIVLLWLILAYTVPRRHTPNTSANAINSFIDNWSVPEDSTKLLSPWSAQFTTDIAPLPCHSHNDYERAVPLFEAIAAGCTSIEADIHMPKTKDGALRVGHKRKSLKSERTLQSLYLSPLFTILDTLNIPTKINGNESWRGIFDSSQATSLVLLLDFKGDGAALWPIVNSELQSLRGKGWLTRWDSSAGMIRGPITVVATGNAPFDLLISHTAPRDIFYDAPLDDIANPRYDATNSYYASVSMQKTIGKQWLWKFSTSQLDKMRAQMRAARDKGLVSRYWETPKWPVTFRDYVSGMLVENGIGVLNIDGFDSRLYFPLRTRFSQNRFRW